MSRKDGSITHWIHEISDGDHETAAAELWNRYFARIVAVAERRLSGSPRRETDEEDIAMTVFEKFFRLAKNKKFGDLADRNSVWRLLVRMTVNCVIDERRKQNRQRRGGGYVRGESVFSHDDEYHAIAQIVGDEPTPEFIQLMAEQMQCLLHSLADESLKEIAIFKMEGYSNAEIAKELKCSIRTIERRLNLIRTRCQEEFLI